VSDYTPTFVAKQVAARLRGAIAQHSISQAELAILCDVSQSQFSKIIRGVRPMTVDQLVVLAEALGLDLGAMLAELASLASSADQVSSPLIYVEDGMTLDEAHEVDSMWLDSYGTRALARVVAASEAAPTVSGDAMDIADVDHTGEVKRAYGLAAKRGTRAADQQPHAD